MRNQLPLMEGGWKWKITHYGQEKSPRLPHGCPSEKYYILYKTTKEVANYQEAMGIMRSPSVKLRKVYYKENTRNYSKNLNWK